MPGHIKVSYYFGSLKFQHLENSQLKVIWAHSLKYYFPLLHYNFKRSIRNFDFFERAKGATTEVKHYVNSQSNVNKNVKIFPNNVDLNVQNPGMCFGIKQYKQKFLCCFLFSFSKYINPTEVNLLFFPTSEHQALIYPLGVLAWFLIPILKNKIRHVLT